MQNQRQNDVVQNFDGLLAQPDTSPVSGALQGSAALEQPSQLVEKEPEYVVIGQHHSLKWWLRTVGIILALLALTGGGIFAFLHRANRTSEVQAGNFGVVHLPLNNISNASDTIDNAQTLKVNGRLQVTSSIILNPTSQPTNPVQGQLYYDRTIHQLAYYNGQQFISIGSGNGVPGSTSITNIFGGSGGSSAASVLLQNSAPGVQQVGNFNITGTGTVGTLKTTVVDSSGGAFYINPVASSASTSQGPIIVNATLGLTTVGATEAGPGINNTIVATKATMGDNGGTATSISVYIPGGSSAKHIQVALYDDDGDIPSRPAGLLSTSAVTALVPGGFNTIAIPSIALTANATYWIAFNTDDATAIRTFNGGSKASCFYGISFGFMPDPFGSGPCFFANEVYTTYVNYTSITSGAGSFGKSMFSLSATGQATFQNSDDSTTAFQIQNASGSTTVFNVDTLNGRIAIGKATAAYKLDIAAGDINLSNGRSLRFSGSQALSESASGTATSVSNFSTGGSVIAQADNFVVEDANAFHRSLIIDNTGTATFSNRVNSTTAFQIQNATSVALLTVDTANMQVAIGNSAGDSTPVILYLANKNTPGDPPSGTQGGMYYNSTLASFRCFYSGFWQNCATMEPQHNFSLYDEFLGGQASLTGQIGNLGWTPVAIGANGSLSLNPLTPAPSADRPGVLQIQTPAVANQGSTLLLGSGSNGSVVITKDNDVKTAVATGAATGQVLRIGLHNEAAGTTQPTSGVWWEADPSANANWRYCYGDGVAATCTATGVTVTANSWVTLEIRVIATGSGTSAATFVINGASVTVSSVTIDATNSVSPALSCYTTTGTAQNCYWDYFQLTGTTSTRR